MNLSGPQVYLSRAVGLPLMSIPETTVHSRNGHLCAKTDKNVTSLLKHGFVSAENSYFECQEKFKDKGNEIAEDQFAQMSKQMETFKGHLEDFTAKHKDEIRKNPEFRAQFQEMCASVGVDPLASSKGFWAEMLGVGDFYYELGVQVIEVCIATSPRNGGLISIEELKDRVMKSRGKKSQDISFDDLLRAIKKLKALGNGFTVIPVGGTYMIQSVPGELSMDHTAVIQQAQSSSHVTKGQLVKDLKWDEGRANRALHYLVKEGLVWVDDQAGSEREYWFPSLFTTTLSATGS